MPLRVHCPQGCLIQVSVNRAGTTIRCPGCKQAIRLPQVSRSNMASEQLVSIRATRVSQPDLSDREIISSPSKESPAPKKTALEQPPKQQAAQSDKENIQSAPPIRTRHRDRLATPSPIRRKTDTPTPETVARPKRDSASLTTGTPTPAAAQSHTVNHQPMLQQVAAARSDRVILTRFYAICVFATGLFNLLPAAYLWYLSIQMDVSTPFPRWAYLQIFVAALHLVYTIYLYQIPDWSTLRMIAIAMLAFAMMYGLISSGLLLGGGQGVVAQFLNLPDALMGKATVWCVAMLCLSTLISYLTGRESAMWCRTETLLNQILSGQS